MQIPSLTDAERVDWQSPPATPEPGELHLWHWDTSQLEITPAQLDCFDNNERERHTRLITAELQQRYAASHVAQRQVLASYLGCDAQQVTLATAEKGKPFLADHALEFNLSHSGNHALLAVATTAVGVDCEQLREVRLRDALVAKHFCPAEQQTYQQLTGDQAAWFFFQTWTRKEAVVKLTGLGLGASVQGLNTLAADSSCCLPLPAEWNTTLTQAHAVNLDLGPQTAAAVAMQETPGVVRLLEVTALG